MTKFFTAVLFSLTLISSAQTKQKIDKGKQRIDNVCDTFMKKFSEGKIDGALQLLKQNTVMTSSAIDTLQVTITDQLTNIFQTYGKMLSSEFVTERKIKDFISKRFYILKFEKYYLKFDFILYKTYSGWTVVNFKYDDELTELLY